jgi:hypothetical protein
MNGLTQLRARFMGWLALRVALTVCGILGALALAAMLFDAAVDLPEPARVAVPWVLGVCMATLIGVGLGQGWRLDAQRVAGLLERVQPALGNRLSNAVQLATSPSENPVEEFLRREAVELGQRTAAGLQTWPVARRGVKLAALGLGAIGLAWIAFALLGGEIMREVWPRFLDPQGDHPPYSKLQIDVMPRRTEVLFGGQVEIRAKGSGRPVEKLWLVARAGTNTTRALMFLAPDKSFFQTLANLREPTEYFVTDGQARSHRFPIGLRYTPQITLVEITTDFPTYTGKVQRTAKLAEEPQALPADTRVLFRVMSNRPLQAGALTLTPVLGGKTMEVALTPENSAGTAGGASARMPQSSQTVTGGFTLTEPMLFTLGVRDVSGLDCAEPRRGRFSIAPDEKPRLVVLEPGRNAVATPEFRVPVKVQVTDDYGVARVVWLRGHNRSVERPFQMPVTLQGGPQSIEATGAFDLAQLGVRAGDVIEYYFEATDNYPRGPNVALSRLYKLQIISQEQYADVLRQTTARKALFEPYSKMGAWLRRLAERSRAAQVKAEKTDPAAARDEAEALQEMLERYERELGKLLEQPAMFDVEQSFRTALAEQRAQISAARQNLKKALNSGQLGPKQLKELSDELSRLAQKENEEVSQTAQQIASVIHVLSRADAFVNLAQQQATLAQMLRRFADKTNALSRVEQMEVQELAHQQRRVQEALHTLLTQLPELLAQVPADAEFDALRHDVQEFLQAAADAKIEPDLGDAAKALDEPDTMTGFVLAQKAAEKMDQLVGKCNGMPQQGQKCLTARFRPKLKKQGLGGTVEQILAAMNSGRGQGGRDGFGLFNDDVGLYGPNLELAGEQAGGRRDDDGRGSGRHVARVAGEVNDPSLPQPDAPGRVRLQPDAKFPLRYRDLVGEYFRTIAESGEQKEQR